MTGLVYEFALSLTVREPLHSVLPKFEVNTGRIRCDSIGEELTNVLVSSLSHRVKSAQRLQRILTF